MTVLIQIFQGLNNSNVIKDSANITNITTTTPITTLSSTPHYFDPTNRCGCENRGWCIFYSEEFFACE